MYRVANKERRHSFRKTIFTLKEAKKNYRYYFRFYNKHYFYRKLDITYLFKLCNSEIFIVVTITKENSITNIS